MSLKDNGYLASPRAPYKLPTSVAGALPRRLARGYIVAMSDPPRDGQIIGKTEHALLVAHIGSFIVPIYLAEESAITAKGTGTLLDGGDRLYLVTASHVLDGCVASKLSSPGGRTLAPPVPWRDVRVVKAPEASKLPDVAIVEFLSPETIAALRRTYSSLTLDRVATATPGSAFILAGFPEEKAKITGKVVDHDPFVYFTTMMPEPPKDAADPNPTFDLFFALGRRGTGSDGQRIDVPNLRGASGCAIWEIGAGGKLWTPGTALRAVGVLRSAKPGAWFRATNWLAGIFVLATFDSQAAHALAVRLIGEEQAAVVFRGWGYDIPAA